MGLLDQLFATPGDQAMWALGSGLLGVRRGNEGQALMGALRTYNVADEGARRNKLTDMQMEVYQQTAADRRKREQAEAEAAARRAAIAASLPPELRGAFELAPQKWAESQFAAPKQATPTDLGKLRLERDALPPGHPDRPKYDAAIRKATEFAPPMQLQMPPPVTYLQGIGPGGQPEFYQAPTRAGQQPTPTGIRPVQVSPENKPMNDTQANASLYATRMEEADQIINSLEGKYSRTWLAGRQALGEGLVGTAASSRLTPEAQQADQAQRDFINAVLRRESGAVISPSEFANARQQYFPQPGDSVEVVKQKAKNRRTAISGIRSAAGPRAPVNQQDATDQPSVEDLVKKYAPR